MIQHSRFSFQLSLSKPSDLHQSLWLWMFMYLLSCPKFHWQCRCHSYCQSSCISNVQPQGGSISKHLIFLWMNLVFYCFHIVCWKMLFGGIYFKFCSWICLSVPFSPVTLLLCSIVTQMMHISHPGGASSVSSDEGGVSRTFGCHLGPFISL